MRCQHVFMQQARCPHQSSPPRLGSAREATQLQRRDCADFKYVCAVRRTGARLQHAKPGYSRHSFTRLACAQPLHPGWSPAHTAVLQTFDCDPFLLLAHSDMSNVLVYSGPGVSASALSHTLRTLRKLLPSYDVQCINAQSLALDPWMESTSLFVLPGGRDLPFVDKLSEEHRLPASANTFSSRTARADQRIREYVIERGGAFIGICAGAYYASAECAFEQGDPVMEVVGERTALHFFPGTCRGTVFPGFVYESDQGARLVDIAMTGDAAAAWTTYYNGGGAFMDADGLQAQGVDVLGRYVSEQSAPQASSEGAQHGIKPGYAGQAAIVRCKVGNGQVILYGTHPEFPVSVQEKPTQLTGAPEALPKDAALEELEVKRMLQFGQHLQTLGLEVQLPMLASSVSAAPLLTPIVLTAKQAGEAKTVLASLHSIAVDPTKVAALPGTPSDGYLLSISDTNDVVHFFDPAAGAALSELCAKADYQPYMAPVATANADEARAGLVAEVETEVDLQKVPKYVVLADDASKLDARLVPHWNAAAFIQFTDVSRGVISSIVKEEWSISCTFGDVGVADTLDIFQLAQVHMYGHVVTSTQTMLDKNYKLLTRLPSGLTSFATHQVSGRGRGKNAWISPLGCLQFSTLLRLPSPQKLFWHAGMGAIVFVQYLAGLAIVESVRSGALGADYAAALGDKLRIKWPNDVYAHVADDDPSEGQQDPSALPARKGTFVWRGKRYAKMAGVLVNSQFAGSELALVVGCGINTLNPRPTTSLSDLIQAYNSKQNDPAQHLDVVSQERFAGAILATLERMWNTFVGAGGNFSPFVEAYRRAWLHSDQETLLSDTVPPTRARIVGITSDYGLLRCVPIPDGPTAFVPADTFSPASWGPSKASGQWIDLQPDGNSFDMLQNLIRRKE